jgi:tetratricopeptide (TPR) repeat protein
MGSDTQHVIEEFQRAAGAAAASLRNWGYRLDSSLGSLHEVDRFFRENYGNGKPLPGGKAADRDRLFVFSIGIYIGEVIRRQSGGDWHVGDPSNPVGTLSLRLSNGEQICPPLWAIGACATPEAGRVVELCHMAGLNVPDLPTTRADGQPRVPGLQRDVETEHARASERSVLGGARAVLARGWILVGKGRKAAAIRRPGESPPPSTGPMVSASAEHSAANADDGLGELMRSQRDLFKAKQYEKLLAVCDQTLAMLQDRPPKPAEYENEQDVARCLATAEEFGVYSSVRHLLGLGKRVLWVTDKRADTLYRRAYALIKQGQVRAAVSSLNEAIRIQPGNPVYLCELGHCFQKLKQHDRAIAAFQRCIAVCQEMPYTNLSRKIANLKLGGQEFIAQGDHKMGDEILKSVHGLEQFLRMRHREELSRAWRGVGFNLVELHQLDAAQDAFNESLRIEPDNPAAMHELEYLRQLRGAT